MSGKFKKVLVLVILSAVITSLNVPASYARVAAGYACFKAGTTSKANGLTFKCVKVADKLKWVQVTYSDPLKVPSGQIVEGFFDLATGKATLVPRRLYASGGFLDKSKLYKWSFTKRYLPPQDLKMTDYGVVSGMGDFAVGITVVYIDVADNKSSKQAVPLLIKITQCDSRFSIEATSNSLCPAIILAMVPGKYYMPQGSTGRQYNLTIQAFGGVAPYSWKLIKGLLPAGMFLDPKTGVIYGAPGRAVVAKFTIAVTDGVGTSVAEEFELVIK